MPFLLNFCIREQQKKSSVWKGFYPLPSPPPTNGVLDPSLRVIMQKIIQLAIIFFLISFTYNCKEKITYDVKFEEDIADTTLHSNQLLRCHQPFCFQRRIIMRL